MLSSAWAKAVPKAEERCLVPLVQDGDTRTLDHFIFQRAHPEGTYPTAGLCTIPTADGLCPIGPLLHSSMYVLKPRLQVLPIFFPRDPVDTWGGIPLERQVRLPQVVWRRIPLGHRPSLPLLRRPSGSV